MGATIKGRICSKWSKFFSLRVDPDTKFNESQPLQLKLKAYNDTAFFFVSLAFVGSKVLIFLSCKVRTSCFLCHQAPRLQKFFHAQLS